MSGWSMVLIMSRKLIVSSSTSILVFLWQSSARNGMSSVWTKPTSCLPDPRSHTLYKLCKSVWWHLPDTCFFMLYLSAHILIFLALFHSSSIALVVLKSNFFTEHRTTTHYVSPSHRFHHLVVVICTSTTTSSQMLTKTSDALPIPADPSSTTTPRPRYRLHKSSLSSSFKSTYIPTYKAIYIPTIRLLHLLHTLIRSFLTSNRPLITPTRKINTRFFIPSSNQDIESPLSSVLNPCN